MSELLFMIIKHQDYLKCDLNCCNISPIFTIMMRQRVVNLKTRGIGVTYLMSISKPIRTLIKLKIDDKDVVKF
jgi:hypothetical protein